MTDKCSALLSSAVNVSLLKKLKIDSDEIQYSYFNLSQG